MPAARFGCPSRIRCQAATGSWTKSRQWETERTLFSSARATMWPPAKVNGVWPFNDAWLRTSLEEARRQAPRNVASIPDSARKLGIRDAQAVLAHGKRLSIGDLLQAGLVREGDQWRLSFKGEVIWGRIESNGQLEVCNQSPREPEQGLSGPRPVNQATGGTTGTPAPRVANGRGSMRSAVSNRRRVGTAKLALVQDAKPDTA